VHNHELTLLLIHDFLQLDRKQIKPRIIGGVKDANVSNGRS